MAYLQARKRKRSGGGGKGGREGEEEEERRRREREEEDRAQRARRFEEIIIDIGNYYLHRKLLLTRAGSRKPVCAWLRILIEQRS